MKFTVLTENHEADGLENEHGLSLFLEYKEKKYLLDAGQSSVFARNAERLGLDLKSVEMAVLSHAHYDHAGGFAGFFEINEKASVYAARAGQYRNWYSMREEGPKYIGIPEQILEQYEDRFVWTEGIRELAPGVWLIPHSTENLGKIGEKTGMYQRAYMNSHKLEFSGKPYAEFAEQADCMMNTAEIQPVVYVPDDFTHEQSLVFETEDGLVVFNSCSHGGVGNIVAEVRIAFPDKMILAYIGGFHLKAPGSQDAMNCTGEEVHDLGRSLMELGIRYIYTGHCTGVRGYALLKEVMGDCLHELKTGIQVEIL